MRAQEDCVDAQEATTLSAIGPTSELDRVVTPPVTMTSTSFDSSACTSSATGMELVRMVIPDDCWGFQQMLREYVCGGAAADGDHVAGCHI